MRIRAGLARLSPQARFRLRRLAALALLVALLGALDAFWVEPRRILLREDARIPLGAPGVGAGPPPAQSPRAGLKVVHLSDLHVSRETPLLRRLVARIAEARPDLIVVSGDLVQDAPDPGPLARHVAALAALVSELRRIAPVYAVQGHSEHQGRVIAALADAGITWLSNEGARVGPGGGVLLLGLNQQVGADGWIGSWGRPFRSLRRRGGWSYGVARGWPYRNFYSHYDPASFLPGASLTDEGGPFAWSGYDLLCDVWISGEETAVGVTAHSRFPLGEDRMIRLIRDNPEEDGPKGFFLTAQGTVLSGDLETGVDPEPGRWYRLRLRTEVDPDGLSAPGGLAPSAGERDPGLAGSPGASTEGRVIVLARVWPVGDPEPRAWQARAEDRSRHRLTAGTAGLWAAGGGTALYRNFRVIAPDGRVLLDRPLSGPGGPDGFLQGVRGTRLALALARSPEVPPGTPRIVLAHTPEPVLEAAERGLDAVLAGHTHGGQVRLPFVGALTTRSRLGAYYDRGLFAFAAPNPRGWTWLYLQPGIGTSLLPIRFWCPPSWAVLEMGGGGGALPAPPPR